MSNKTKPCSRKNNILVQEVAGETLVYDLKENKAFCLNKTSSLIWQMCDGKKSISEITKLLSNRSKSIVSEDVVWLAIDQFKQDNLLEDNSIKNLKIDGMPRREVIRKVGLASMIALPLISSIAVPKAASAQSNCSPATTLCGNSNPATVCCNTCQFNIINYNFQCT